MEGCLATSSMLSDRHVSKTYPRKGEGAPVKTDEGMDAERETW